MAARNSAGASVRSRRASHVAARQAGGRPTRPWKRQFYGLWWDAPKPEALVEAKLDRTANTVRVTSDAPLTGMYVLLDDELLDLGQEVVVEANGEEVSGEEGLGEAVLRRGVALGGQ